jgi:hypothetical protein
VLYYTPAQLCHHEVAQTLLGNPPSKGAKRRIWYCWHQNLTFHVDAIHYVVLKAQAQVVLDPPLAQAEYPVPPAIKDTGQLVSMPTIGGQPLTCMVTIDDAMSICILISNDAEVSLMSLHVFLTLQIPISIPTPTFPVEGPGGDVVETHESIMLPFAFGITESF